MSDLLPLFPLGSVLFPGALLPLHIFEPRYRVLIRRSVEAKRPFGIVLIRSGEEVGPPAEPHQSAPRPGSSPRRRSPTGARTSSLRESAASRSSVSFPTRSPTL